MAENSQYSGALGGAAQGAASGSAFGPWGAVAGGVLGGVSGFLSGGGEKEAMKLAEQQMDMVRLESQENLRRMRLEMSHELGQTKAGIGGSNLQFGGSSKDYYNAMESSFLSDTYYEKLKTSLNVRMIENQGQAMADRIEKGGLSSMLKGFTSAAGAFGSMGGEPFDLGKATGGWETASVASKPIPAGTPSGAWF